MPGWTRCTSHVVVVADGFPLVIPTGIARDGDRVLVHGSPRPAPDLRVHLLLLALPLVGRPRANIKPLG
jgi:hypothetical protein